MHYCSIGLVGATALAEYLKSNGSLMRLVLKNNPLTQEGCVAILSSLANNTNIFGINLDECGLEAINLPSIIDSLSNN